ncbi:10702_t:CDS:2 [Entrophospora sp. SA101]|nr:1174_t:CDS:2 [Entrophospora sp. SA101]CAJ0827182.1 6881_t:CDS:2 [Entrophospora sp. SA101]CAJ0842582.1 10702_t:CDS:2 [Entrophospora sp. SA101]
MSIDGLQGRLYNQVINITSLENDPLHIGTLTARDNTTSYPITVIEANPESIDFPNLYCKITTAKHDIQKPNKILQVLL